MLKRLFDTMLEAAPSVRWTDLRDFFHDEVEHCWRRIRPGQVAGSNHPIAIRCKSVDGIQFLRNYKRKMARNKYNLGIFLPEYCYGLGNWLLHRGHIFRKYYKRFNKYGLGSTEVVLDPDTMLPKLLLRYPSERNWVEYEDEL